MCKSCLTFFILVLNFNLFARVHTGRLELSTFLGRQQSQKDHNSTFSGGMQIGFELLELGIIELSAETGFGTYPDNNQRIRNFDIALKNVFYKGEVFFPFILGGIGLMTYNSSGSKSSNQPTVTFAKTTINFGIGFRARIKKEFYARVEQKYFLFSKDSNLTYRSLTALGVSYLF